MISPSSRLRILEIAHKIQESEEVSFEEMTFIQKWADHNRHAYEILQTARRKAIQGEPEPGSIDQLVGEMNLGFPDPSDHLIGPQSPDDLANFFKAPPWMRYD